MQRVTVVQCNDGTRVLLSGLTEERSNTHNTARLGATPTDFPVGIDIAKGIIYLEDGETELSHHKPASPGTAFKTTYAIYLRCDPILSGHCPLQIPIFDFRAQESRLHRGGIYSHSAT